MNGCNPVYSSFLAATLEVQNPELSISSDGGKTEMVHWQIQQNQINNKL